MFQSIVELILEGGYLFDRFMIFKICLFLYDDVMVREIPPLKHHENRLFLNLG